MSEKALKYAWCIFLLCAAFCAYEFILRVKLSPLSNQLLAEFNTSANALGFLSSAFFYGYAPVQLLAGPIIQRYGPKLILTIALLLCAAATLLFAISHHLILLFGLRLLMGIGGGFAFMGAYMLIANWFPTRQWAFLYGLLQFIACLGAMYGQQLLAFLSDYLTWRTLSLMFGYIGIALTLFFYFFLKDAPKKYNASSNDKNTYSLIYQLKQVALNPSCYPIALYALFSWGPITISATLWGPAFLAEKLLISVPQATYLFSYTWLGIALGSPYIGYLVTRLSNQRNLMIYCSALGFIACFFLLNNHLYSANAYKVILFFLGFSTAAQPITFVKIQRANPDYCRGTAVGFNNTAVVISGALLQPLSSFLIERSYYLNATYSYQYTLTNYQSGLLLMPFCFFICLLLGFFFVKEQSSVNHSANQANTYNY